MTSFIFILIFGHVDLCGLLSSCNEQGPLTAVHGLLTAAASLAMEHGLQGARASAVAVYEVFSCSSWALVEKGTAVHSNILAWRIAWTEKPGGVQSVGSQSQT